MKTKSKILTNGERFDFKKKFGQNFLTDKNLLASLVRDSNINEHSCVLEIGVGLGTLTEMLAKTAKKVVGYEIDLSLKNVLEEKFCAYDNVEIVFKDALKTPTFEIEKYFEKNFCVVANIPYNITTPLIFKFMEETNNVEFMAIMVQKEVAERICAKVSSACYGALSVTCQHFNECKILRVVSKKMFNPMPKVDSAFLLIKKIKEFDSFYANLVKNSFLMRRKTLINNLIKFYPAKKEDIFEIFKTLNFEQNIRAENLSEKQFYDLSCQIKTKLFK